MKHKISKWGLLALCFLDCRLHLCGPWTAIELYPLQFGGFFDQFAHLTALILVGLALGSSFLRQFSYGKPKSHPKQSRFPALALRSLLLIAFIFWVSFSGLPFSQLSSETALWVNQLAYSLSTLTGDLPLNALVASACHCLLCLLFWDDWQASTSIKNRESKYLCLGLVGLIALGTDAFLGYASGSPFFVLE